MAGSLGISVARSTTPAMSAAARPTTNGSCRRTPYNDDGALGELLADAGFHDVQVDAVSLPIRFADWHAYVRMNATAIAGLSARFQALGGDERASVAAAIFDESETVLKRHLDGDAVTFEIRSNVATARG
jgi:hypothetical protein